MKIKICLTLVWISGCGGFQSLLSGGYIDVYRLHKRTLSIRFSSQNDTNWKAGDVYRDLDALEYAINFENAEENLKHAENMEILDFCAQQRREISSDIKRFVYFPLAASLLLRFSSRYRSLQVLIQAMTRCFDLHFWLVVVTAPALLLLGKIAVKPQAEPMPEELKRLDPEYLEFVPTDWMEPGTSCQDYIQFLLEYWVSAVLGIAMMGTGLALQVVPSTATVRFWMSIFQPIARIGALASIHQFQGQLFKLLRSQQPRPIGFFPTAMQLLLSCIVPVTPLAVSFDVRRAFLRLRWDGLVALHMSIIALFTGTIVRMNQKGRVGFQKLEKRSILTNISYAFAAFFFWKKSLWNFGQTLRYSQNLFPKCLNHWAVLFASSSVGLLALLGPCIHIHLLLKQFRIVYTHGMSLSDSPEIFNQQPERKEFEKHKMKWRFRIEWREEQRLKPLLVEWISGLDYWFFVKGTVREQIENEEKERAKERLKKGNMIWEKVQEDGIPITNRQRWKADAMDGIAKKHQDDYDKQTFEDPLGVAVQQTLGIGLGFKFDHMRPLEPDEKPSVRRLQARAAKSAIRRVQELYDADAARKALDHVEGPEERDRRAIELREQTAIEIKHLADRLTDLVPTSYSGEFKNFERIDKLHDRRYKRMSSHEYTIDSLVDDVSHLGLKRPRQMSRVDGVEEDSDQRDPVKEFDKEFMESYLEHLENHGLDDDEEPMVVA